MPKPQKFKELLASTRKTYMDKHVPPAYQKRYGKVYDRKEAESIAFAIAKKRLLSV